MGVISKLHLNGDNAILNRIQDVEPVIQYAKDARSIGATGSSEMRHAARVPAVLVESYCNRNGITMHEFMANDDHVSRLLNDPAIAPFRIWQGKV